MTDDARLLARIAGEPTELPRLRSALSDWLASVGVGEGPRDDMVLATHELAAEAIERGAAEVAILGEVVGAAIRLSVAGGDWSSLDELRSTLVHGLIGEIRIHRGIVTIRLTRADPSGDPGDAATAVPHRSDTDSTSRRNPAPVRATDAE